MESRREPPFAYADIGALIALIVIMKPFTDTRRILWLGGIALILLGLVAAFIILPASTPLKSSADPDVRVPKMENVPEGDAPKLKLDVEKKE